MTATYTSPLGDLVHPVYTQAVWDLRRRYSLTPIITEERIQGAGRPVYFTKVNDTPDMSAQAGMGTPIYQQSSFELVSIDSKFYSMETIISVVDETYSSIDLVAQELDNIARAIVRQENTTIWEAISAVTYGSSNNNLVLTATSGTLDYSDIIDARNLLRQNNFGMGVGQMALLVGTGSTKELLNDEKLVNTKYVTAFSNVPTLNGNMEQLAIGGIPSIGLVFELPEITDDAYLIDIPYALKSIWRMTPVMKQIPSRGTMEAYEVFMDFGVKALNEKAIIKIDITHS